MVLCALFVGCLLPDDCQEVVLAVGISFCGHCHCREVAVIKGLIQIRVSE